VFVVANFGDFPGKIMDVSVAQTFGLSGRTTVWMLMAAVTTGFSFIIMTVTRFVGCRRGHASDNMAVAVFD
jgi:hypothetical protein